MRDIELVIFDCDGVLVDSEVIGNKIMAESLTSHGLAVSLEECMRLFVGMTMAGVREKANKLGASLPEDWVAQIYQQIYARLRQGCPLIDGVTGVLDSLGSAGIPFCVASNGSFEKMEITLGQNGLLPRFEGRIYSAQALNTAKPAPELFWHAAGDFPPESCVVIEDSLTGVRAARAAGMRCFAYAPDGDDDAFMAEKATPFAKMADLPALLGLGDLHVAGTSTTLDGGTV